MVEEIKKVISIDTSQAVQSLDNIKKASEDGKNSLKTFKDYKQYIEEASIELSKLDKTSAEYDKQLNDLNTVQGQYNKALELSKNTSTAAEGSYAALAKQMAELKKAFKTTTDETERADLAKKIVDINDQLKEFDASIGNYQRNVGNYASAFTSGLDKISDSAKALNSPLGLVKKGVSALNGAFKALIANPIGAVIASIVVIVKSLVKAFKNNEEASNKLKKAFSALEPITNAVKNALGKIVNIIGDILVKVSELANGVQKAGVKIAEFLNKLGIVSDAKLKQMKDTIEAGQTALQISQELADAEIALTERKRKYAVLEAKSEAEVSELRAKAAEKEKYTAKQRSKFLEEAKNKEKALYDEKLKIAEEEFRIAKMRADQAPNSAEDNEALAQSEANLYRVRKEYNDKARELNANLAETTTAATKEQKDAVEESIKALEAEKKAIENRLGVSKKGSEDYFKLLKEQENKEWEIQNERFKKENYTDEQIETYRQLHVKNLNDIDEQQKVFASEREKEILDVRLSTQREGSALYYELLTEQENKRWEMEQKRLEDEQYTDEQIEVYRQEHLTRLNEIQTSQQSDALEKKQLYIESELEFEQEYTDRYRELTIEKFDNEWEQYKLSTEYLALSEEEKTIITERENKRREKLVIDSAKAQAAAIAGTVNDYASAISGLFDAIASNFEEGSKEAKAFQIMSATINMLGGVAAAVASAMTIPPPAGPILGAANAATVIATGVAQIAKIKSTKLSKDSSASTSAPATVSTPAATFSPQYTSNVTGASDVENLQNAIAEGTKSAATSQKVYVLESDITDSQNATKTRVEESEF